jgi:oxygen-dependent protoporphyrinogen oxidase
LDVGRITVLEAAAEVGGKLVSHEVAGLALDAGAESVLARRSEATDLIRSVGLGDFLVNPDVSGAGLWLDDRLLSLPKRQLLGIPYDLQELADSDVLDKRGLLRVFAESSLPCHAVVEDVSVGRLVRERMGRQVVDRLVEPVLGGVYAGSAEELSLDMAIPGLREQLTEKMTLMAAVHQLRKTAPSNGPVFASLSGGLARLPPAIASIPELDVRTGTAATALRRTPSGWVVVSASAGEASEMVADAVVLACPADAASRLLGEVAPDVAQLVGRIEYASVGLVTYVFNNSPPLELPAGTGFLVPPAPGRALKAATFASQKWRWLHESHPDRTVIRVSMGRFEDEAILQREDEELAAIGLTELSAIVGRNLEPVAHHVTRWTKSLPQYRVGHRLMVEQVRSSLAEARGVAICGAAFDGLGIAACIASGQQAATRVAETLRGGGQ